VLVIAHRLSTIRQADRIVVLDAGKIAEIGSHDELIARRGIYQRLHEMQHAASNANEARTTGTKRPVRLSAG
jgi:ABC-type multidrug transport system fused ATPase/permease subunit